MAWTPIKLRKGGEISFAGEAEGVGGGSQSVQAQYGGNVSGSVADGGFIALTWDRLASGTELLDRSSLTQPLFLTTGTYAITLVLNADSDPSPGGYVSASLSAGVQAFTQATALPLHDFCISTVAVISDTAAQALEVDANNFDGNGVAHTFQLAAAVIVKLA